MASCGTRCAALQDGGDHGDVSTLEMGATRRDGETEKRAPLREPDPSDEQAHRGTAAASAEAATAAAAMAAAATVKRRRWQSGSGRRMQAPYRLGCLQRWHIEDQLVVARSGKVAQRIGDTTVELPRGQEMKRASAVTVNATSGRVMFAT